MLFTDNRSHLKALKKTTIKFLNQLKEGINEKQKPLKKYVSYLYPNSLVKSFHKKLDLKSKKEELEKYFGSKKPQLLLQKLQEKVELIASKNNNQVFLKQSKFWASAITWSLMGGVTFAIGWLSIAKTDEVVIAIGKLEPKSGVVDVQLPVSGITRKILVKEGEEVKRGQLLILLDNDITEERNRILEKTLDFNNIILEKLSKLSAEGAVPEIQYLEKKAQVEEIKSQINTNLITLNYQEIRSPVDGIVFKLQPKGEGYVANSSEPILKIVPFDNLIARVEIDSRTIGFVKTGKKAEISIDSFPATDFGIIEGSVTKIGSDALMPDPSLGKGYRFPAEITLDNQYLKLRSGRKLPLQAGMSLSANIKLRKVTYIQLLLNNFTEKTNSLKSI